MSNCIAPGWGTGVYGQTPWGGGLGGAPGGPLPTYPPFDVFCVGPCGQMLYFETYTGVLLISDPATTHFYHDPSNDDFVLTSGGGTTPYAAHVHVGVAVPDLYTFEGTFLFDALPADFSDVTKEHAFYGSVDAQGACAGLFFSKVGIAYTGSVTFGTGYLSLGLIVNSPIQLLPDSPNLIKEGVYYSIRIAVDSTTKTTFVYVTETSQLPVTGHVLRYILPAISTDSCPVNPGDEVVLSVCGSLGNAVTMQINSLCLGTGLIIPNIPPLADAGPDQAARTCSIIRLDGRASFDPEGTPLQYQWRLTDGPDVSSFVHPGFDGSTNAGGLTNKFYSPTLASLNAVTPIAVGDVVLIGSIPYTLLGTGTDGFGFYVTIDGYDLAGNLVGQNFKLLKQNSLSNPTSAQPTFFPDVPGLFKFDLKVFDGGVWSLPSNVIVNVTDSPVPRGITPDLSFLWNYISDFWKLVETPDVIPVFWGALAQVAASELLTLWQHEYSKSLRDVQRTFQRRWLHYDLFIQEPFIEQTTIRALYGGIQSVALPTGGISGVGGTLVVASPLFPDFNVFVSPANNAAALPDELHTQLKRQLQGLDARFDVKLYQNALTADWRLLVTAPFPFAFTAASTSTLFTTPVYNDTPQGSAGAPVGVNTYVVDRTLQYAGVLEGDYLVVDGVAYRIKTVLTNVNDAFSSMRVVTSDPLPLTMGKSWIITGATRSKFLDFYSSLCSSGDTAFYEVIDLTTNELVYVPVHVLSAAADGGTALLVDTLPLQPFLAQPKKCSLFFHSIYRRTYMPLDPLVRDVPTLQERIKNTDDTAVLRQNIDFYRESYRGKNCLRFITSSDVNQPDVWQHSLPARRMWAETTYIDNRPVIEQNFGIPAEFTLDELELLPDNADYLSMVRGLWYAYFNGPTLFNLRAGTQILLGLPFAEETGTIVEIRTDFSPTQGRILVQDASAQEIVRTYSYPSSLALETNPATGKLYAEGDTVEQFAPLVEGVEVVDYIKNDHWFEGYLNQGSFYEIEKFFKFLVRVDSAAFTLPTILFAEQFVRRIKPTYTHPLFVVLKNIADTTVDVTDSLFCTSTLYINTLPCNYLTASNYGAKVGGAWDDPRSAGGGWWSQLDSDAPILPAPTYPTATRPIHWGLDRDYLCPEDFIVGKLGTAWAGGTPILDGLFTWDSALMSKDQGSVYTGESGILVFLPLANQVQVGTDQVFGANCTLNTAILEFRSDANEPSPITVGYTVNIYTNNTAAVLFATFSGTVTIPAGSSSYRTAIPSPGAPFAVTTNMMARVFISSGGLSPSLPAAPCRVLFTLGNATAWFLDTAFAAGNYEKIVLM